MTDEPQVDEGPAPIGHHRPPMPEAITTAICEVMGAVKSLAKDAKNPHANYKYASVEGFLELIRPLCAKAGLVIDTDEEEVSFRPGTTATGKAVNWLLIKFSFTLSHKSGVTWAHRPIRTAMVNANMGSQAFGAAQSYAFKSYTRMLFMISTGEEREPDIDQNKPEDLPAQTATNPGEPHQHGGQSEYEGQQQPDDGYGDRAGAGEYQEPLNHRSTEPAAKKADSTLPPAYQLDPSAFLSGTNLMLTVIEAKDGKKYWKRWHARMIELVYAATDLDTLRALEGDNTQIIVQLGAAHAQYFAAVSEAFAKQRKIFEDMNGGQEHV